MPISYALQRSMPTGMLRRLYKASTAASNAIQFTPTQMGTIGTRELESSKETRVSQILETIHDEVIQEDYKAYELDWLLALEIRKQLPYNHKGMDVKIRCWHGMDDDVSPLGNDIRKTNIKVLQCGHNEKCKHFFFLQLREQLITSTLISQL